MRYSIVFALAAGVSAVPALVERVYVTEMAYVTDIVTVTAGAEPTPAPAPQAAAAPEQVAAVGSADPWSWWKSIANWQKPSQAAPAPAPATTAPPPPPPAPTTYHAPPKPAYTPKPAPPKPKPSPPKQYTPPSNGGGKPDFKDIVVMHHNIHRKNHSVPDLSWDQGLADTAKKIAGSCYYAHDM